VTGGLARCNTSTAKWGPRWQLALAAGAVLAGCTLAGCGVGAQGSPEALDAKSVPYGLLGPSVPTSRPATALDSARVTVWLEGSDDQLVPVPAYVPWPATIGGLLNALAQGPTSGQSERGFVSPASSVGPLSSGPLRDGVVPVELPASFENLGGPDQVMAAAQIVYTLTGYLGVRGVVFGVGGQRVQVPDQDGRLLSGPLTRKDYSSLPR
jgi:spore germination protein GerM